MTKGKKLRSIKKVHKAPVNSSRFVQGANGLAVKTTSVARAVATSVSVPCVNPNMLSRPSEPTNSISNRVSAATNEVTSAGPCVCCGLHGDATESAQASSGAAGSLNEHGMGIATVAATSAAEVIPSEAGGEAAQETRSAVAQSSPVPQSLDRSDGARSACAVPAADVTDSTAPAFEVLTRQPVQTTGMRATAPTQVGATKTPAEFKEPQRYLVEPVPKVRLKRTETRPATYRLHGFDAHQIAPDESPWIVPELLQRGGVSVWEVNDAMVNHTTAYVASVLKRGGKLGNYEPVRNLFVAVALLYRAGAGELADLTSRIYAARDTPRLRLCQIGDNASSVLSLADRSTWAQMRSRLKPEGAPMPDVVILRVTAALYPSPDQRRFVQGRIAMLGRKGITVVLIWVRESAQDWAPPADMPDACFSVRRVYRNDADLALLVRLKHGSFATEHDLPPKIVSIASLPTATQWNCDDFFGTGTTRLTAFSMRAAGATTEQIAARTGEDAGAIANLLFDCDAELQMNAPAVEATPRLQADQVQQPKTRRSGTAKTRKTVITKMPKSASKKAPVKTSAKDHK